MSEEYKPSHEEKELIKKIHAMMDSARKARRKTSELWRESEKLYMGNHWEGLSMPEYKNQLTLDMIANVIDTQIPIMSSQPPKIDVIPVGATEESKFVAKTLQAQLDDLWYMRDMATLVPEWLTDYLVYGTGIVKLNWNMHDDLPDCDMVDPFSFYVNPSATKLENAQWIIHMAPRPLYEIKELFPEKGHLVKSMGKMSEYEALKITEVNHGGKSLIQVTDSHGTETNYFEGETEAMQNLEERALLVEVYMRDGSVEYTQEESNKDGKVGKPKYPGGLRKICMANDIILYDGPSRYQFLDKMNRCPYPFPYVVMKNGGSAHSFWGKPEPKRLKSINLALDRIASQVMDNVHLIANPMFVVDETADVQDQINNKPGSVIRKRGPGQVSMLQPASIPGYVFNFYQLLVDMFETVSGVNKATMGKQEPNVTSGVQAQVYRTASTSKIDFKSRQLDSAMQILGQMWIAMIKNMGTENHSLSMKDAEGNEAEVVYQGMEFADVDQMVRARVGSMLPDNRTYVEEKILSLAQAGLIQDPEYILENMQLPGIERLINEMREKKQQQQPDPSMFEGMSEDEIFKQLQANPQLAQQMGAMGNEPGMD
tara:strand:+ start:751 stop:2544 length:1794 start_codon:yes stop_codon:yes gene_type:complete